MAKEQFRTKNLRREIAIKLKKDNGIYLWKADAYALIAMAQKITEEYLEMGINITLRQLYYDMVSRNAIPNHDTVYKKISTLLTDARYLGLIDWDSIEDRNRPHSMHSEWDDVNDLMKSAIASYRLPRWSDQDYYVEVSTEKDALSSIIEPICNKWHVRFNVNKGYSSASVVYQMAKRICEKIYDEKHVVLLYIGDHDASGLDMVRDIRERVGEFMDQGDYVYDRRWFEIKHIALTMEQVKKFNPPQNPAKITDPRAKWYIKKYGPISWEVEALKAPYLRDLVQNEIVKYLDYDSYKVWLEQEDKEKKEMKEFAEKYKNRGKAT